MSVSRIAFTKHEASVHRNESHGSIVYIRLERRKNKKQILTVNVTGSYQNFIFVPIGFRKRAVR